MRADRIHASLGVELDRSRAVGAACLRGHAVIESYLRFLLQREHGCVVEWRERRRPGPGCLPRPVSRQLFDQAEVAMVIWGWTAQLRAHHFRAGGKAPEFSWHLGS